MLYSRPQLRLLLVLAAIFLLGLGLREWRAGFPAAADRLERFGREEASTPLLPSARPLVSSPEPRPVAATPPGVVPATPRAAERPERADAHGQKGAGSPATPRGPVDLNRATAAELARLPGVGAGLAQRILEERERRGRFDSPEALRQVLGFGPKKLAAIRGLVTVDDIIQASQGRRGSTAQLESSTVGDDQ